MGRSVSLLALALVLALALMGCVAVTCVGQQEQEDASEEDITDVFVEFVYPAEQDLDSEWVLLQEDAEVVDALAASDVELEGSANQLSALMQSTKECDREEEKSSHCSSALSLRRSLQKQHDVSPCWPSSCSMMHTHNPQHGSEK